jgi:hypothetical protein
MLVIRMSTLHKSTPVAFISVFAIVILVVQLGTSEDSRAELYPTSTEIPKTLHEAALKGNVGAVESLLKAGADPNAYDQAGLTPLHWAVHGENKGGGKRTEDYMAILTALLGRGANPNEMAKSSSYHPPPIELPSTALVLAAKGCADRIVAMLLKAGADPNLARWGTPLQEASGAGCPETVRLLIESGAEINQQSSAGTALVRLARRGWRPGGPGYYRDYVEVAKLLVAAGANLAEPEAELRLTLRDHPKGILGRRWANEILAILQKAMERRPPTGDVNSTDTLSHERN